MTPATWAIYPLACAAIFYLAAQAKITSWLWSRYPPRVDAFVSCPACLGFWLGLGAGGVGWWRGWSFLGLPHDDWLTVLVVGLGSIIWTPLIIYLHTEAMTAGATYPPHEDDADIVPFR